MGAIFTLKMHEHEQHFWPLRLCHFKKGTSAAVRQEMVCGVCGEDAVTDGTCPKWIAGFMPEMSCAPLPHG